MTMKNRFLSCRFINVDVQHIFLGCMFCIPLLLGACSGDGTGLDVNGNPLKDGDRNSDDMYSAVQEIFTARCIACHAGSAAPQGLILSENFSYDAIVNIQSNQQTNLDLVEPGQPEESYLIHKIRGDAGITGGQMPRNGPPFLDESQIQTIVDWVSAGAPEPQEPDPNSEYIAELSNFQSYRDWTSIDYSVGATNTALGAAHKGDDENFSRRVFINSIGLEKSGEEYPNGTILVKETTTFQNDEKEFAEMAGLTAMVKRGAGYNETGGGWEWFDLSPDISAIQGRGADLMGGMCSACHQGAEFQVGGEDYVFPHPSELVVGNDDFSTYLQWELIDSRSDNNELLDNMAHGATLSGSTRRVYKKQLYANPDRIAQGYPVGTTLIKEVTHEGGVVELTAMVKRGGAFNENNGFWEWFMVDPETLEIMLDENDSRARGANLMNGMCSGCHFAANTESGHGIDYVFKHGGDPFNNNEEFVASISNFQNYLQWPVVDYSIGDTNIDIGGGHQGLNNSYSRLVYMNEIAAQSEGGDFQKGSILIKEITSWESGQREFSPQLGLVAMVKRGANFNTENNGWEWFDLATDTSQVIGRGGDFRNNGCNSCHLLAEQQEGGKDYVFAHPTEFVAQSHDFSDYGSWSMIDERSDENPLLGGMAHKGDDPMAIRRVFKKQLYASPDSVELGFPVGTVMVKEVTQNNTVTELAGMVKRGGSFNTDNRKWEWFMLDPLDASILEESGVETRGADLMAGMCNSCHSLAETGEGNGKDYVFFHANDPRNQE